MAQTILEQTTVTVVDNSGMLVLIFTESFALTAGETYRIVFDNVDYNCTAAEANFNGTDGVGVGNFAIVGLGENTGEPFLIGIAGDGSGVAGYTTDTTTNTHTIAIYTADGESGETPSNSNAIVLKDRDGNDVPFEGVGKIKAYTADGGVKYFAPGEPVVKTLELDFSAGDMEEIPEAGQVWKKVSIPKPDTLIPENIAKNVNIAGIIGTSEGGSGSVGIEKTAELNFRDFSGVVDVDTEEAMEALLDDESKAGLVVRYVGIEGAYVPNRIYEIINAYETFNANDCSEATAQATSGTTCTASINCNAGDLLIAAFAIRSALVSLSDGWSLVSTSQSTTDICSSNTNSQTLSFAYKYATTTTESLTVTQKTSNRALVNIVSFNAIGFVDEGYQYQNNKTVSNTSLSTFVRPNSKLVLWGLTKSLWLTSGYPVWEVSNDSRTIQLGSTTQSRLLLAIDTSEDESVTFSSGATNADDAVICGALSITLRNYFEEYDIDKLPINESQTISADEGTLMKSVTVLKPETLTPVNIPYGVNVAGVVGERIGTIPKAINFYDVDGNIVHSYTRAEAALLTELPKVPTLGTLEGSWSHTLEQVKAAKAFLDVGATYKKNGNLTVVAVIERPKTSTTFYYNFYVGGACTINMYGNPSADTTLTTQTRTTAGVITLSAVAAASAVPLKQYLVFEISASAVMVYLGGYSSASKPFFGNSTSKSVLTGAYNLLSVVCSLDSGNSLYLRAERYSFYNDYRLKHICCYSINTYTSTVYSPYYCYSLQSIVTTPAEITSVNILGNYTLSYCQSLKRAVLGRATSTSAYTLNNFVNLRSVILHDVSQVNFPAGGAQELIITTTSTPGTSITLGTNAAQNLRAIYVPDELVDTYKTNWSGYAGIIRSLSQYPDY